jgi:hypothetical protein
MRMAETLLIILRVVWIGVGITIIGYSIWGVSMAKKHYDWFFMTTKESDEEEA